MSTPRSLCLTGGPVSPSSSRPRGDGEALLAPGNPHLGRLTAADHRAVADEVTRKVGNVSAGHVLALYLLDDPAQVARELHDLAEVLGFQDVADRIDLPPYDGASGSPAAPSVVSGSFLGVMGA